MSAQAAAVAAPDQLDWLARHIVSNRFLPVPDADRQFVGDGDFRAIGAEFLLHFVRLGGLGPDDSVLDLGCGIGRMALPLTQYLSAERGRYDGIDVVAAGIDWCTATITTRYPNFRFHRLDVRHPLYNPAGALDDAGATLPVADGACDFAIMTSVLTHLRLAAIDVYLREIARALRPGGRLFATAFLLNAQSRAALRGGRGALPFAPDATGPEAFAHPEAPLAAVAQEEAALLALAARHGLAPARPVSPGAWPGRGGHHFQDICVLHMAEG